MSNKKKFELKGWHFFVAISIASALVMIAIVVSIVKESNREYRSNYASDVSTWLQDVGDNTEPSEVRNVFITNVENFTHDGAISDDEYKTLARDYKAVKESVGMTDIENTLVKIRVRNDVPLMINESDIAVDLPFEVQSEPADEDGENNDFDDNARTAVDEKP